MALTDKDIKRIVQMLENNGYSHSSIMTMLTKLGNEFVDLYHHYNKDVVKAAAILERKWHQIHRESNGMVKEDEYYRALKMIFHKEFVNYIKKKQAQYE